MAYVVTVATRFPGIIRSLLWNTDAAGAFVVAALFNGHSRAEFSHFGFWTSLWWLLGTRSIPGHVVLWDVTGAVFALATAAFVGWATWRVAGRWAGVAAAAVAVAVGPAALTSLLTVNFHTSTPFTAAVLAAYLVVLTRTRSWFLAAGVGVLAGLNAASDPLLSIGGLAPFAVGAAVLAMGTKRRDVAARAAFVLALTTAIAFATDPIMSAVGFHIIPTGVQFAGVKDLFPNFIRLGKSVGLLWGANHFFPGVYPSTPIRYVITLLSFAGLAATFVAALRLTVRRSDATMRAYAWYWASAALFLGIAFVVTNQGTGVGPGGGANYVLPLIPAIGAGLAVLAAPSSKGRTAVSLGIALVAAVNVVSVLGGRAEPHHGAQAYGPQLIRMAERTGVTKGYAPYWDAQSLTWKSKLRLLIVPVQACEGGRALCPFRYFTIDSWYREGPGRSFLIVDPANGLSFTPPAAFGTPSRVYHVGPDTLYVYPYDLARSIR